MFSSMVYRAIHPSIYPWTGNAHHTHTHRHELYLLLLNTSSSFSVQVEVIVKMVEFYVKIIAERTIQILYEKCNYAL